MRVRATPNGNFVLWAADGVADVANRANQQRVAELFREPTNEYLNQLGIVFMRVCSHAFAQFRTCEHAARLPHLHL